MLNLVKEDELIKLEVLGGVFYARRPCLADSAMVGQIMRQAREKRDVAKAAGADIDDPLFYERAMLEAYLRKWEQVGFDNEEVPYSPELVERLPYEVAWELALKLNIIRLKDEAKKGESSGSSSAIFRPGSTTRATRAKGAKRTKGPTA